MDVVTDMTSTSDGVGTFPTPILETSAIGPESPRETGETKGGGGKAGNRDDDKENEETSSERRRGSLTPRMETTEVVPECGH